MTDPAIRIESSAAPMMPDALMALLDKLGIAFTRYDHKPLFTVADGHEIERGMPGLHCRNLFLRDAKKQFFLLVLRNETTIDIKKLPALLNCKKLSFGSADDLYALLGVRPGAVCPFSIVNDGEKKVSLYLDKSMMAGDIVNYHPLVNTMTIGLTPDGLLRFIEECGHTPHIVDFGPCTPDTPE